MEEYHCERHCKISLYLSSWVCLNLWQMRYRSRLRQKVSSQQLMYRTRSSMLITPLLLISMLYSVKPERCSEEDEQPRIIVCFQCFQDYWKDSNRVEMVKSDSLGVQNGFYSYEVMEKFVFIEVVPYQSEDFFKMTQRSCHFVYFLIRWNHFLDFLSCSSSLIWFSKFYSNFLTSFFPSPCVFVCIVVSPARPVTAALTACANKGVVICRLVQRDCGVCVLVLKNQLTLLQIWLKSAGGGFCIFYFFFLLVRLRSNFGSGTSY